jgi:hypothetical protein
MSRYAGPVILGVLVGGGAWFFGLAVVPSIVVAMVVAALGITLDLVATPTDSALSPDAESPTGTMLIPRSMEWPPAPPQPNDGARREVSELGWALRTPTGVVEDRVLLRVRNIAATSLRRRQLDLDNPAHRTRIEALLGAPLYAVLRPGEPRRTSVRTLRSAVGLLEALETSDPASRS